MEMSYYSRQTGAARNCDTDNSQRFSLHFHLGQFLHTASQTYHTYSYSRLVLVNQTRSYSITQSVCGAQEQSVGAYDSVDAAALDALARAAH